MASKRFAALIDALRDPAMHAPAEVPPGCGPRLDLIETHISSVILTASYAYKLKKPVNLGFLDFRSLESRRFYCEEELRLNRRTAPDLYLDVVPVTVSRQGPRFGGQGKPVDYALRMRRFPQDAVLERMAGEGRLGESCIDTLAGTVAGFHAGVEKAGPDRAYGSTTQVRAAAMQNFDQIRALSAKRSVPPGLAELRAWTAREHASLSNVFEARKRDGFVRECHGDLHLGNVVVLEGAPVPFDCIEFNAAFRWIDVMNEVAFLVMDLLAHGLSRLAWRFLNRYLECTGDYEGLRVLRFYLVYRALVRAKVARIREGQSDLDPQSRDRAGHDYASYLDLATKLKSAAGGAVIAMHGLSGSGKTTVARELAALLPAIQIRSDVERKRLHGIPPEERTASGLAAGIYRVVDTRRTYERLAELAAIAASAGYNAIVDAAFLESRHRQQLRAVARSCRVPFAIVDCVVPDNVLRERVARRQAEGRDASEAGLAVLEHQLSTHAPLGEEEAPDVVRIANGADAAALPRLAEALRARLRPGWPAA